MPSYSVETIWHESGAENVCLDHSSIIQLASSGDVEITDFCSQECRESICIWRVADSAFIIVSVVAANPAYRWQRLTDYRDALFSLSAFKDSLKTLVAQDWPLATTITTAGFNPADEYLEIIYNEGQHLLFEQKSAEIARQLTRQQWDIFVRDSHWSPPPFEALNRAIAMIQARGARVVVFINPYHRNT